MGALVAAPFTAGFLSRVLRGWVPDAALEPRLLSAASTLLLLGVCWRSWWNWMRRTTVVEPSVGRAVSTAQVGPGRDAEEVRRVSTHEAAHAVVALALGHPIRAVSIEPSHGSGGRVVLENPAPSSDEQDAWWARAVLSFAGAEADRRLGTQDWRAMDDMLGALQSAAALASIGLSPSRYVGPLRVADILDSASTVAANLVARYWESIEAVSAHLQKTGHLTSSELTSLLPDKLDDPGT